MFVDNSSEGGKIPRLHEFFDATHNLEYPDGYFPEIEKCALIATQVSITQAESLNA